MSWRRQRRSGGSAASESSWVFFRRDKLSSGCRDKHCTRQQPRLITKVSWEVGGAWSSVPTSSVAIRRVGAWASSNSLPTCPATSSPAQCEPTAVLCALALKINYSVEVRGEKTKADPSVSGAGGQCRSAAGKWCDSGIYHRGDHRINTRSAPPHHKTPLTPPLHLPQPLFPARR